MIKTIILFFLAFIFLTFLYGEDNFSQMSTQELISIIGYVKDTDAQKFKEELRTREKEMSESEKKIYEENLKKIK